MQGRWRLRDERAAALLDDPLSKPEGNFFAIFGLSNLGGFASAGQVTAFHEHRWVAIGAQYAKSRDPWPSVGRAKGGGKHMDHPIGHLLGLRRKIITLHAIGRGAPAVVEVNADKDCVFFGGRDLSAGIQRDEDVTFTRDNGSKPSLSQLGSQSAHHIKSKVFFRRALADARSRVVPTVAGIQYYSGEGPARVPDTESGFRFRTPSEPERKESHQSKGDCLVLH